MQPPLNEFALGFPEKKTGLKNNSVGAITRSANRSEAWLIDGLFDTCTTPPKVLQKGPAIRA
jgi:hypothetical protein